MVSQPGGFLKCSGLGVCFFLLLPNLPQALQIVWPCSSRLHSGVIVVPQFWHAITTVVFCPWSCPWSWPWP